jgi:hypothetical protein
MVLGKRIRIDIEDGDGVHYNLKLEGDVSKEKLLQVCEMMEMLEGRGDVSIPDSVGAKIWHAIEKYFGHGGFTSNMVLEKYEDEYNEPIKLSVISTYLARYSSRMKLHRMKTGREWTYALAGRSAIPNSR